MNTLIRYGSLTDQILPWRTLRMWLDIGIHVKGKTGVKKLCYVGFVLGHTRYTHSYILNRDPRPQCERCHCPRSVKHFVLECPNFANQLRALLNACRARQVSVTMFLEMTSRTWSMRCSSFSESASCWNYCDRLHYSGHCVSAHHGSAFPSAYVDIW